MPSQPLFASRSAVLTGRYPIRAGVPDNGPPLGPSERTIASLLKPAGYATALMARNAGASSRTLSIMVGGGLGSIMFLNVWMIIWPLQKKIIAAVKATAETGAAAPADQAKWARRAFLASRANAWLSVPMLFFMGAASHFPIFSTIDKVAAP